MSDIEVKCPSCGYINKIELDDPHDGEEYEAQECHNCDNYYKFELSIFVDFSACGIEVDNE